MNNLLVFLECEANTWEVTEVRIFEISPVVYVTWLAQPYSSTGVGK